MRRPLQVLKYMANKASTRSLHLFQIQRKQLEKREGTWFGFSSSCLWNWSSEWSKDVFRGIMIWLTFLGKQLIIYPVDQLHFEPIPSSGSVMGISALLKMPLGCHPHLVLYHSHQGHSLIYDLIDDSYHARLVQQEASSEGSDIADMNLVVD